MSLSVLYQQEPSLTPIYKRHWWILNHDWQFGDITIPAGFLTDLDSIPHVPILFSLYKGRSRTGALGHDYLYATGIVSRYTADTLFLDHMLKEDIPEYIAYSMFWAVRLFGWRYYRRNRSVEIRTKLLSRYIENDDNSVKA